MPKFKYPAKMIHTRYGASSQPAGREIRKNSTAVIKTSTHRASSQKKANRYAPQLKKKMGQKKLKSSCTA